MITKRLKESGTSKIRNCTHTPWLNCRELLDSSPVTSFHSCKRSKQIFNTAIVKAKKKKTATHTNKKLKCLRKFDVLTCNITESEIVTYHNCVLKCQTLFVSCERKFSNMQLCLPAWNIYEWLFLIGLYVLYDCCMFIILANLETKIVLALNNPIGFAKS